MAKNRMAEVAKLLDVEENEPFMVDLRDGEKPRPCVIKSYGLRDLEDRSYKDELLVGLLTGYYSIKKAPWRAKAGCVFSRFVLQALTKSPYRPRLNVTLL